jgi:hypothetical protein
MNKYQGTNPIEKLHPGEPFFLIRAQDVFSPAAVMAYGNISNQQEDCHEIVERFLAWQKEHPDKVKRPD